MIACFDVHYFDHHANAAAVVFRDWSDSEIVETIVARCNVTEEYCAGEFYKRELEPLLTVIDQLNHAIGTFVVDAYCHLSEDLSPGLGQYLHDHLAHESIVVGVAKNQFRQTDHAIQLLRGQAIVHCSLPQ